MEIKKQSKILWIALTLVIFIAGSCSLSINNQAAGNAALIQTDNRAVTSAVSQWGRLKVTGSKVTSQSGASIQLKGMSLFWSQWAGSFYNANVVSELANNWSANLVRAAMGVEEGGYLTNPAAEKSKVITVVDAAIANNMYVIIDWHDHNATSHTQEARTFFREMAQTYGDKPNVIFEVFNEPLGGASWSAVKTYAIAVIGEIRTYSSNLVVVGSPTWSQDVHLAAADPITRYSNVAYSLHFYAGTHGQWLRDRARDAMNSGIAIMVTEWGTCDASGNGGFNSSESQAWLTFMKDNSISWANWSLFNKDETASALVPSAGSTGPWSASQLTQSGQLVKQAIMADTPQGPTPTPARTATRNATPTPTPARTATSHSTPTPAPVPTATASPPPPAGGVTAEVIIANDWGSGYIANLEVTNNTTAAVQWNVTVTVEGMIINLWNGQYTQTGNRVTISGVSWNSTIQPGQTINSVGFQAVR